MRFLTTTATAAILTLSLSQPAVAQHRHAGHGHSRIGHIGHGHLWYGHNHGYHHNHYRHNHLGYYSHGYPVHANYTQSVVVSAGAVASGVTAAAYSVPAATTARLQVHVPAADAQVWLEGTLTTSRGMTRVFESPPLEPGQSYTYSIRAAWPRDGWTVTEDRQVYVVAGRISAVDFSQPPPAERAPPPTKRGGAPPEQ